MKPHRWLTGVLDGHEVGRCMRCGLRRTVWVEPDGRDLCEWITPSGETVVQERKFRVPVGCKE